MQSVRITYDAEGDILYLTFGEPTAATGYQLSDQILLRVDPQTQRAAGLTIFNYSVHASTARKLPLPGIEEHPDTKPTLLKLLTIPPVKHFLRVIKARQGVSIALRSLSLHDAIAA
jgi:uncharacterized protein YuzE